MSIWDKVRAFEFDKNRKYLFGIKSAIVWGHSKDTNGIFPLLYVSKPKHISLEEYEELLKDINITFIKK